MTEIYFDNSATTKMSARAMEKMLMVIENTYGNPSSLHTKGLDSERILKEARQIIGKSLGRERLNPYEIVFTSGGTEANNLAIFGTVYAKKRRGNEKILTTEGEHASVERPLEFLEGIGYNIVRVPTRGGEIDLDFLRENAEGTILATFMHVNNETGALYNLKEAFEIVKEKSSDALTHADCVQSYLKVKFTQKSIGADLISISSHKVNGSKGVGALYINPEIIKTKKLVPISLGGGQEGNFRSGTENVYGIASFAEAVKEHLEALDTEIKSMRELSDYLKAELEGLDGIKLNLPRKSAPHIINLTVKGIRSEIVLHFLASLGIYVSSGSACSSNSPKKENRALSSFGLDTKEADSAIRISLSPQSTKSEGECLIKALIEAQKKLARR